MTTTDPVANAVELVDVNDAEQAVSICKTAIPKAEADEAEIKQALDELTAQQAGVRRSDGIDAAMELDEAIDAASSRAKLAKEIVGDRRQELVDAEKKLVDALVDAKAARMTDIARSIIKADQDIDRARLAVGRAVQRRLDLGDELLAGRSVDAPGPSVRQIRGTVHLLPIILAPLAKLFPTDLSRPHPQLRGTTLAAFERRLFARWLGNGVAGHTTDNTTPADAPAEGNDT